MLHKIIPLDVNLSYRSFRPLDFQPSVLLQRKQAEVKSGFTIRLGSLIAVILLLFSPSVPAATINWTGTIGDWSDAISWGGTLPTSGDDVYITNDGTVAITQLDEVCLGLYLGNSGTGHSGNIQMTAGSLTASYGEIIGNTGIGTFTQSGGNNTILGTQGLVLGFSTEGNGSYNLSGSGQLSAVMEIIGISGTGRFNQSGGNNNITSSLSLGSQGTYTLSGSGILTLGTYGTVSVGYGRFEWFTNGLTTSR